MPCEVISTLTQSRVFGSLLSHVPTKLVIVGPVDGVVGVIVGVGVMVGVGVEGVVGVMVEGVVAGYVLPEELLLASIVGVGMIVGVGVDSIVAGDVPPDTWPCVDGASLPAALS